MTIEIDQADYMQINNRIGEILAEVRQAQAGADQQRQNCLDHIFGWTSEIGLYLNRGVLK